MNNFKKLAEIAFFKHYVSNLYPSGVVSYVSDTYDFWAVITELAPAAKQEILNRTPDSLGLAKVVFRPDSGDPVKILTGYTQAEISYVRDPATGEEKAYFQGKELSEAGRKGAVECLAEVFGTTVNAKGYKTLNERVGLIYGDSITLERAREILTRLQAKGYASDNVVFGIGSFTFQYNTRDTFGFAMKATYVEINGEGVAIFKDPKTDDGMKKSAKGLLAVEGYSGNFKLINEVTTEQEQGGELRTAFLNGAVKVESYADIRSRLGIMQ